MAIITTICSSSSHSHILPTMSFPTLKTHHSLQPTLPCTTTSSKYGANFISSDALVIAATEAVAVANAAVEVARDVVDVSEAGGIAKEWPFRDRSSIGLDLRRKKRRKRRKSLECMEEEEEIYSNSLPDRLSIRSRKSGILSSREEAELCLCLKEGAKIELAKLRINESKEHPAIPMRRLVLGNAILDKVLCNTRESRERIAREYRGLVASIASSYQGKGLSFQDLMQEGTIGLLKGAEKFDPDRGNKLSTYVYWWIKQAIIKAVAKKSRLIRLPGGKYEMIAKIAEANNVLSRRLRRVPSYNEMAELLNVNVSTVKLLCQRNRLPISLNKVVTDRGTMTLQDIIAGPDEMIPEKMVERELMKEEVLKLLKTLTKREEQIVRLYFGLNGETPLSFEEIGRVLKLSRERVRQINGIAMSKLQQTKNVDSLKFYLA
ncbi:PREDICTED: RNA polymerase sigma factor sigD, chloroplastic [Lupinus angustifolius]|nr:PREDICTED: RNA polymerase sigma factor sigD, chloroplastic [Lupinus angustifolius]